MATLDGCRDVPGAAVGLGVYPLIERSTNLGNALALAAAGGQFTSDSFDIMNAVNKTTSARLQRRGCTAVCGGGMVLDIWADVVGSRCVFVGLLESIDVGAGLTTDGRFVTPPNVASLRWSVRVTGPIAQIIVINADAANAATVQLGVYLRNR